MIAGGIGSPCRLISFHSPFMVKLNIGPVREDHVVTANPDQIFLYLDMRYRDVLKMIRYELAAGNRQYVGVTRDLIVAGTSMTDNNDKTISK